MCNYLIGRSKFKREIKRDEWEKLKNDWERIANSKRKYREEKKNKE